MSSDTDVKKIKMRLLISYTSYPANRKDWRGVFIYNLTTALAKINELEIKSWGPPGVISENISYVATPNEENWLRKLITAGGIAHLLRTHPIKSLLYYIPMLLLFLKMVYRRTKGIDLYHVNWLQNVIPLGTKSRQPLVISVLGSDLKLVANPLVRYFVKSILRKRRCVLCPNGRWMAPVLEDYFGKYTAITYVPFGIDEEWFDIERDSSGADHQWLVVLRMTKDKVGKLFDWGEDVFSSPHHLTWLGPKQEEIEIPAWLDYQGATNPNDLQKKWFPRSSGIITLSEHDEGQPQILLEAMAAGLPIIASNIPAHRNLIINYETGILINSKDELKSAISFLSIRENNMRVALQARNWARSEIGTWDDCAQRYLQIYKQLLSDETS
jgi:glycosyltransferase involved in cell wall biosynthesis